jgi:urea transport system ATP-binding protein
LAASAAANAFTNALAAVRARAAPASAASGTTARPTDPLLQVDALQQYYGGSHILRNVGFSAAVGEVTVVLGRNGVGKTTLLKSLMGVVPVRSGSVRFGGADITAETPYQRARRGIGYVPQGREIFARLTVAENLQMGLATRHAGSALPAPLFELFPVLKAMLHRRGGDLSGGQQQQLAIARALAAQPTLLVLDEPTEGIQPSIIKDIGRVIRTLADVGLVVDGAPRPMAIVLVEQYYDFAAELADRYLVMERGEVVQRGRGADMHADGVRARMSI